jgi:hypothetical protein
MRLSALLGISGLLLSACVATGITTYNVTLDGKSYRVVRQTIVSGTGERAETRYVDSVSVNGVDYPCAGDCSLTVQRVLEEIRRREVIKADKPNAVFPPIDTNQPSH